MPLHERIDRLIEADQVGPRAALTGDAEFLRRVALDLTGMPPAPEELDTFLADGAAEKRSSAIDRLLASPLYGRHLAEVFDVMWMERRTTQNVSADDWQNHLIRAFRDNRPLNRVIREILSADGADPALRPAARFYLDREGEPNLITRDVGRLFFGRDLLCAQCHNHPMIDDYRQSDYHGLLAFFTPGYALVRKEGANNQTFYAEKAGGDLTFNSVFVKNDKHRTGPRLPGGIALAEPSYPPGEEYRVKPAANVLPVPRFSHRAEFAARATDGGNKAFNENLANRLWALMMGRGLVHPLDLQHPANPPSHPELLALLADELVRMDFDARAFLRALALTRTYQRSIDLPVDPGASAEALGAVLADLKTRTEELSARAKADGDAYGAELKAWHAAEALWIPAAGEQEAALGKHAEAAKKQAEAQKGSSDTSAQIAARRDTHRSLAEAADKAQEAVKKLPAETELAAAAQKFADRARAMTAELAALEKTGAERSAALEKAIGDATSAAAAVEAAREKARPPHEALRAQEQVVRAARDRMAASRVALEHHKLRLDRLQIQTEAGQTKQAALTDEAIEQLTSALAVAPLRPLSPEQMYWSMLTVTGVYDRARQAEEAELEKAKPLTEEARDDDRLMHARACEVVDRTMDKLKKNLTAFVRVYAAGPGQPQDEFFATADQALFAANDSLINGWIAPAGGNLSERMVRENDPEKAALDLYRTVLARTPSALESADVARVLSAPAADRTAAVQELVWGLLTSVEFRFNH
jgi:hypothetical protein